jgi:hypothetical protein
MLCDLKSISADAAQRAVDGGATVSKAQPGMYSGGHSYNHTLTTNGGKTYRLSDYVFKALVLKPETVNLPLW